MRKNFTLLSVLSIIAGSIFIACSNDDIYEIFNSYDNSQQKASIQRKSLNYSSRTMEDVKETISAINNKYGSNWKINENNPIYEYDSEFLLAIENVSRKKLGLEPIELYQSTVIKSLSYLDDTLIDEVSLVSLSSGESEIDEVPNPDFTGKATAHIVSKTSSELGRDVSPYIYHSFDFSYEFHYINHNGTIISSSLFDMTNSNKSNLLQTDEYQNLSDDELSDLKDQYSISYDDTSIYVIGLMNLSPNYNENIPLTIDYFSFTYGFKMSINGNKFDVITQHPYSTIVYQLEQ